MLNRVGRKMMKVIKSIIGVLLVSVIFLSGCMSTNYLAPVESSQLLTIGTIYIVLDNGSEIRLKNCVFDGDLLVGFTKNNQRVEVELSQIRRVYYKKIKPVMPYLAVFSAGTVGISIWLFVGALTAPGEAP
jgi:hypothetical protein